MELTGAVGIFAFMVLSLAAGARLVALYARTRQAPELALALAFICGGTLGWGGTLVGTALRATRPEVYEPFAAAGNLFMGVGAIANTIFLRRVFRPTAGWARAIAALLALAILFSFVHDTIIVRNTFPGPRVWTQWPGIFARLAAYAWGTVEGFAYYPQLRRQLAIGLTQPLLVNRVLMWALGELGATSIGIVAAAAYAFTDADRFNVSFALGYALLGAFTAAALVFAFLPPKSYARWVSGGAESA